MDLTCRRPPVASRAFIFNSFPAASALSLGKHDALMIFFHCASDRLDLTDYSGEVPFRQRLKAIKIFLCPWVTFTASQHGGWQHSSRDFRLVSRYGKNSSSRSSSGSSQQRRFAAGDRGEECEDNLLQDVRTTFDASIRDTETERSPSDEYISDVCSCLAVDNLWLNQVARYYHSYYS